MSGRVGPTLAIRPGGRGNVTRTHLVWTSPKGSPFVPSPIVKYYLGIAHYLGSTHRDLNLQLFVTESERRDAQDRADDVGRIHAGSRSASRTPVPWR